MTSPWRWPRRPERTRLPDRGRRPGGFDEPGRCGWGSTEASCPSGAPGRWSAGCRARRSRGGRASCGPGRRAEQNALAPAPGPVRDVLVAARGRPDRELPSPRPRPGQGDPGRRPGPHREIHDERARRHRHPRDPAELAHRRPVRQGRAAEPRARSRSSSSSSTFRPTPRFIPTARPGTPSTPRNRPWPSTPPIR